MIVEFILIGLVLAYMGLPLQIFGKVDDVPPGLMKVSVLIHPTGKHVRTLHTSTATGLAGR